MPGGVPLRTGLVGSFGTSSIFSSGGVGSTFTSARRLAHSLAGELIGVYSAVSLLAL
jgi:hypothetical protein